ncbi:hypothetical protein E4U38_005712 [Claviceps purpurea]|nr:hypothetical protein E4U38_005712 [Claviceps purpurea]
MDQNVETDDPQEMRRRTEEMERQIEEMRRQRQEATRLSTILEYVSSCHKIWSSPPTLEETFFTDGYKTEINGKLVPRKVAMWNDFLIQQRAIFDEIYNAFPPEHEAFKNQSLVGFGLREPREDHERFITEMIEKPVVSILENLVSVEESRGVCRDNGRIIFLTPHYDPAKPTCARDLEAEGSETEESENEESVLIRRPHRFCTRVEPSKSLDTRAILYVCEIVKPCGPTKHLREALRPTTRFREASQAATAEAWVYHAIVYLYNHLLESGSEFGILITGQAMVFLQVKLDDPGTLYYHISEPCRDVAEACEEDAAFLSAVGQCVAFTMMALQTRKLKTRQPLQEIRLQMHKTLPKWGQPSESPLEEGAPPGLSPPEDAISAPASSSSSTEEMNTERQSDQTEPGTKLNGLSGLNRGTEYHAQDWPYCTQRCLLGLVRGECMDSKCPNVMLHCQGKAGEADSHRRHPISHSECLSLLRDQFKHSLDEGITYDGIFGSFSMLFKVTLLAYGYTFVSKGTISTLVERLKNEAKMYKQLEPIQGTHVPVFLGTIDLRTMDKSYSVYWGVDVVHMIFYHGVGVISIRARWPDLRYP